MLAQIYRTVSCNLVYDVCEVVKLPDVAVCYCMLLYVLYMIAGIISFVRLSIACVGVSQVTRHPLGGAGRPADALSFPH